MEVKQVYELVNLATSEILGAEDVLAEDLSNVVDIGEAVFNANAVDRYVKSLVNHIGCVIFVNRKYTGNVPSVLMDAWEFGSILEKVRAELPEATENESWELENGASYDPNIFYQPQVSAKFFNKKVCFEIPMSFTEMQVKQSFSNAAQLNGFLSMLYNSVDKAMTIKIDSLIMSTIANMIGETVHDEFPSADYGDGTSVKAVNLLYMYNERYPSANLTAENAITEPAFIRFAAYTMGVYSKRMSRISNLFNIGGTDKFTPPEYLHWVLHSDFAMAADVFLQSDTFHNEFTKLPAAETVPFWQGSGDAFDFEDTSKINIKTASNNSIEFGGILGIMFDREALGVANLDRRVTTNFNPKAEFFNNWYKFDAGYFNDTDENFVVFYVADEST